MSKTPNYDSAVKKILGSLVPGERTCVLTGEKWLMTDEEIDWYKKFNVPPSRLSPLVRAKLMFGFPSGLNIWWKARAESGQPLLSCIHKDSLFKILSDKEWSAKDFSRLEPELEIEKSFFEQLKVLTQSVPVAAQRDDGSSLNTIGTDILGNENAWMVFSCGWVKNCHYGVISYRSEDCLDFTNSRDVQNCYTINHCDKMYNCCFCFESRECLNCNFLFDCRNCENCFGATNKRNKKYLYFNQQLSKEAWEEKIKTMDLSKNSSLQQYQDKFASLMSVAAWPENFNIGGQNNSGEYLLDAVNCKKSYRCENSQDNYRCVASFDCKNAVFSTWIGWSSNVYNCCDSVNADNVKFCFRVWYSTNLEYCLDCMNCDYCFGCVGLQRKKFHIFNVAYSETEYWSKLDAIKCTMLERGEYGEYLSAEFSAVGFQFSMGDTLFNYSEQELSDFKAPLFDPKKGAMIVPGKTDVAAEISTDDLPDDINDSRIENFIGKPIVDKMINRNFIITKTEFDFYRQKQLPLPRQHFLSRLKSLTQHSNLPISEKTTCGSCQQKIVSYKNGVFFDRKIYCHDCYLKYLEQNN